ncbi:MAG: hypothetical protein EXQ70_09790 [Solirubrobacterales bacterium]|nr:hypothetical protein [Solirubrobacterales bacterium]
MTSWGGKTAAGLALAACLLAAWAGVSAAGKKHHALGPYPKLGGCSVFPDPPASLPANAESLPNQAAWNQDISQAPAVDPETSPDYIGYINAHGGEMLHPDFGSPRGYGFPYSVVGNKARKVPVKFTAYGDESDHGAYRVPPKAPVEGGNRSDGDRHVLTVDSGRCQLQELYRGFLKTKGKDHWNADGGVIWNLRSTALRHEGWTSADAAGLPIFPGLVRFDEVQSGEINHAIRVTFDSTQDAWIHPASHCAGDSGDPDAPPMGLRLRLAEGYDISGMTGAAHVIAVALKRYGFINADNGSNWFFSGTSDHRWPDNNLNQLKDIPGDAFEVVQSQATIHTCGD